MRASLPRILCPLGLVALAMACREDAESPVGPTLEPAEIRATIVALTQRQVSVGAGHACGVTTDDRAYCWGNNSSGELGNATLQSSSSPVAVAGNNHFRLVSAGRAFTCGVTTDNRAYCWGHNPYGQLGSGVTGPDTCFAGVACSTIPVPVAGSMRFSTVSAGQDHACAVTTGARIYCWGLNPFGQVGDGTTGNARLAPVPVAREVRFSRVDAGNYHTCALTPQHRAYCWGENSYGQLGIRGGGRDWQHARPRPTVVAGGLKFMDLKAGYFNTCGLTLEHRAFCWGDNSFGALGNGLPNDDYFRLPSAVAGGLSFRSVETGYLHGCGLTTAGVGYCWGLNAGEDGYSLTPVRVAGGLRFDRMSTGYYGQCGITRDDRAYCWDGVHRPAPVPGPM